MNDVMAFDAAISSLQLMLKEKAIRDGREPDSYYLAVDIDKIIIEDTDTLHVGKVVKNTQELLTWLNSNG